ncbi:uncharacterized protein A4U43_C05F17690 [Asparagus officinalis]|uniref:Uncharacterized protein n=1 Tax=Asparagus officinalis TaxID=4686 RepID=A0A5P1ESL0_ASPOF|nr:uncharacterized protein A4U43_C05F17690 [Asparagus officinalis]
MGRIMVLVRASGLLVAVLLLIWAFGFRASFLPHSNSGDSSDTSQMGHLYSALHPLLMVIGFILLSGEVDTGISQIMAPAREQAYENDHAPVTRRGVHRRSTESTLVNALGLGLSLISTIVFLIKVKT